MMNLQEGTLIQLIFQSPLQENWAMPVVFIATVVKTMGITILPPRFKVAGIDS